MTVPLSWLASPMRIRMVVDLPAPLAPMNPMIVPVGRSNETSSSAKWGYRFETPWNCTARLFIAVPPWPA